MSDIVIKTNGLTRDYGEGRGIFGIDLEIKKPVWTKDGCACCLGCIHRCPEQAIQYGKKTESRGRYTNPNVKL